MSYSVHYQNLPAIEVGRHYALVDPSTPVRTGPDLATINDRQDGATQYTTLRFGHTMQALERIIDKDYVRISLPTLANEPLNTNFTLGVEWHKFRVPLSEELARHYMDKPDRVVVGENVFIFDKASGTLHKMPYGSYIHGLDLTNASFTLGEEVRKYFGFCTNTGQIISELDQSVTGLAIPNQTRISYKDFQQRLRPFIGTNFSWAHDNPLLSDASGWIQNLLSTFGIHLPHNTYRMEQYLQQNNIGRKIESLDQLRLGDIVFIGSQAGKTNYMGLINPYYPDPLGRNFNNNSLQHCRGRGAMQIDQINSETDITSFQGSEVKSAWRLIEID